jgi:hypothetical protein
MILEEAIFTGLGGVIRRLLDELGVSREAS